MRGGLVLEGGRAGGVWRAQAAPGPGKGVAQGVSPKEWGKRLWVGGGKGRGGKGERGKGGRGERDEREP